MKKLKNKVFYVLFGIFTFFLVTILLIFNIQDYKREISSIENTLITISNPRDFIESQDTKIFIDYTVYVVTITRNGDIIAYTNHSQEETISENDLKKIVYKVVKNYNNKKSYVGNIYFEKYSYALKNDKVIIIDNTKTKERIIETLKTSVVLFIILEFFIVIIVIKITKWIIKPVECSFERQKRFIADASHELKTPLAVIMASSEALENDSNETKWIYNIKSEAERMNDLITSLLEMAKTEKIEVQHQNENISKIIEKSMLTFESLMFEKNIKLEYKIEDNLILNCNSAQIKQLAGILIDNAVKYVSKDGDILITLSKEKNNIVFKVRNKGKEIPKEEQEKIFERFYRIDESRNRNQSQYGLGLAIAKNIVENHNGDIKVNSENGYTTFICVF